MIRGYMVNVHAVHNGLDDLNPYMLEKAIYESGLLLFEDFV